jgi:hypothetical protein
VQLSVKYETVLNMTTAKALGLDVPTSILLSADERNTATQEDWIADGGNGSVPEVFTVISLFPSTSSQSKTAPDTLLAG